MRIKVRETGYKDFEQLENILIENDMLACPEIDGKEVMYRIRLKAEKYFLVAEADGKIVGLIRGCYDGSRALIHQMAVLKDYQRKGIGKALMNELAKRFRQDGALSISVTSGKDSESYYKGLGFQDPEIKLLIGYDINEVIEKTK
ncbi:MAG TPA: GNAT family N-acetyltransferase [Patescibacteria group bacterium]|nr:GNAT family N-acetyltransferase [Patescibacteria group bacterium]